MSCRTNRSSVNWGEQLAREPGMSAPPATSPECRALVADAEAAARYLATYGMKIRGATVEETEAARYALPRTPGIDPLPGPLPPGWEMAGDRKMSGVRALDGIEQAYQVPDQFVEIYVSAGPAETNNASCDADHDGNCLLYRVLWNLPRGELVSMERVDDDPAAGGGDMGEVQPALSPDGRQLAWIRRFRDDGGGITDELVTRRSGSASRQSIETTGLPQFPNWYSDDVLLYHKPSNPSEDDPTTRDDNMSTLWAKVGDAAPVAVLGYGSGRLSRKSFQDADTHPNPAYRVDGGPRVVTFGGVQGKKQPRVTGLYGEEEETFHLGFQDEDDECHHPAWNIEGSRILCHRNRPPEDLGHGRSLRALFEYQYASPRTGAGGMFGGAGMWQPSRTSAGSSGRVFDPKTPEQLQTSLPGFPMARCKYYFYKYAEWCGTDDYVLTTLYCKDDKSVVSSRVLIVHLRETEALDHAPRLGGTRYSDVTLAMENAAGVRKYSWRGIFGTCSTARSMVGRPGSGVR